MTDEYEPDYTAQSKRDIVNAFMELSRATTGTRNERTHAFLEGERLDALLGMISFGISLRDTAAMAELTYSTLQKRLTDDPDLRSKYEGARVRQSEAVLDEIAEIERKTEHEGLDPKAAGVLIGSKQWRAERLNPKRYGPRSFQHIETIDQTALHLEAVRQLARERREAIGVVATVMPAKPVIEGHCQEVIESGGTDKADDTDVR